MKQFNGFPARMQFTPVPNLFFSSLLPQINNIAELKVTLHIFRSIYSKKGYLRFVTTGELLADKSLLSSLSEGEKPAEAVIREALEMAVKRGTILHLALAREGKSEDVYFLNTDAGRKAVDKIKNGELTLVGLKGSQIQPEDTGTPPDIFTLYEDNIGMLTPMIADELREAAKLYPETWIREAVKEAVDLNKRSWRYIERILENWSAEGRGDGTNRGDSKTGPNKFSKQKYGDIVRR